MKASIITNPLIAQIYSKSHHGRLLNALGLTHIGVEIGTYEGLWAWFLLQSWQGQKLYTIDPYVHQDPNVNSDYDPLMNAEAFEQGRAFGVAHTRLEQFGQRVEFIRKFSHEAADRFNDESLDFVYVDGNHTYEAVLQDLDDWYPKIKKGGLLFGDDYDSGHHQGVIDAIDHWTDKMNVEYCNGPYGEPMGAHNQWYVMKSKAELIIK